jgi:hypothetical protein
LGCSFLFFTQPEREILVIKPGQSNIKLAGAQFAVHLRVVRAEWNPKFNLQPITGDHQPIQVPVTLRRGTFAISSAEPGNIFAARTEDLAGM